MDLPPERLEIRLNQPNPLFEKWLQRWLHDAEARNCKSQHKIREALQSLRSYPLPISTGRECAILRGFGTTLCNLIDDELRMLQQVQPLTYQKNATTIYQEEVQQLVETVKKAKQNKARITKKEQKAIDDEEERIRQVSMAPGNFKILLLVDTQETSGKNKRTLDQTRQYLESLSVEYEVRRLTIGDFLWIARDEQGNELVLPYIVERKRMDDLASSIRDGRFHEQKHRLRNCGLDNVFYLVEDYGANEHIGLPLDTLLQAMTNIQIQSNFNVTRTENHWRSIAFLKKMTQILIENFKDKIFISVAKEDIRECDISARMIGLMKFREFYEDSSRNAQVTVREIFVQQLLQLHSLSIEKAVAIVERYPTPRLLFDAYDECSSEEEARMLLANIRYGKLERPVGEKISKIMYDFYRTEF